MTPIGARCQPARAYFLGPLEQGSLWLIVILVAVYPVSLPEESSPCGPAQSDENTPPKNGVVIKDVIG